MSDGTSDALCHALGTTWWLELPATLTATERTTIETDVIEYIKQFEADYSRFLPTSLVSQLNDTGQLKHPSPAFVALLTYGQTLYTQTDGLFNILIGTHLVKRGYDSSYSFTPQPEPTILPNPTTDLHIADDCITLEQGTVDVGGFGKGYLIDLLADRLSTAHQLTTFLINGGGDMYAKTVPGEPTTVYLAHPRNPALALASTTLDNGAFAASSPHLRSWTHQGQVYNHLVHSTNTNPGDSVFTKASTAALADALATTLLLLDPEPALAYCTTHQVAAAFYHTNDARLVTTPSFTPLQTY